ncbi:hypothetical protein NHX12_032154 [Muraenolepis orangiensis]|uniref:Uncharacterized protein n=1 Tax=Muraenolepis orangiensis TaxID=630683 RepID=A0A9Q0ILA3_9TELE|nr:hypothetical protein NHX12_032154 [Muraenolepis orangiensis]
MAHFERGIDISSSPCWRKWTAHTKISLSTRPLCGKALGRFVGCFDAIKAFLAEKGQDYPELEDEKWVVKLMFLTDITGHLNKLNLKLQGAGQTVASISYGRG